MSRHPDIPVDFEDKPLAPGDEVIMVRPATWNGAGGFCRATIVRYNSRSGHITVEVDEQIFEGYENPGDYSSKRIYRDIKKKFATPYRKSKFYKEK